MLPVYSSKERNLPLLYPYLRVPGRFLLLLLPLTIQRNKAVVSAPLSCITINLFCMEREVNLLFLLLRGSSSGLFGLGSSGSGGGGGSSLLTTLALQNLFHNLLLLNEEGTDDAVAHTASAARATVSTGDGLAALGEGAHLAGSDGGELLPKRALKSSFKNLIILRHSASFHSHRT